MVTIHTQVTGSTCSAASGCPQARHAQAHRSTACVQAGQQHEAVTKLGAPMCSAPMTAAARPRSPPGTQAASSSTSRQLLLPAARQHTPCDDSTC